VSDSAPFFERHYYLLRRLHSLTGIAPIGLFLLFHLTTNSSIVWGAVNSAKFGDVHGGAATFQHEVSFIHSLPALILLEVFGLWLPILFHSVLGFYYAASGKSNTSRYGYQANWRYTLQRVSGYLGFVFIFYHVATLRWGWTWLVPGGTKWSAEFSASTLALALQGSENGLTAGGVVVSLFYMAGVTLLVFHFANGLWTAAITWGLTVSEAAQRRWGFACIGIGAALMLMAWSAVIGFATLDVDRARQAELSLRTHGEPAPADRVETTDGTARTVPASQPARGGGH